MKYTKGEWKAKRGHIETNGQWICQLWSKHEEDFDNAEANAFLIAAPDMYEALKAIIDSEIIVSKDRFNNTLEALAKAEGR